MKKTAITAVVVIVVLAALGSALFLTNPSTPEPMPEANAEDINEVAVIETKFGNIVLEFFPDKAPRHVENFKKLARDGFYDGITFHRVIPGFMIQGGDPNSKDNDRSNDGRGGPGYSLPQELNDVSHVRGVLSMARSNEDSGSQFFIMIGDATHLDRDFSAFGRVIDGMAVVDQIVSVDRDGNDNPTEKIEITVRITTRDEL